MPNAGAVNEDYGRLEDRDGRAALCFTRRFDRPPETVWRALTEPDHLEAWFPTTIAGPREAGAKLHFSHPDGLVPPFDGEMLVFDPPARMELLWGDDLLTFELRAAGDGGCLLQFSHTFDELGKAARDAAGWHTCFDLLAHEVAGGDAPYSSPDRWRQLRGPYIERFGPEASTVGPPEDWERANG